MPIFANYIIIVNYSIIMLKINRVANYYR